MSLAPRRPRATGRLRRRRGARHEPRPDHLGGRRQGAGAREGSRRGSEDRRPLDHRQPRRARDALARRARNRPDLARAGGDHPPRLQGLEPQRARESRLAAELGRLPQRARAVRRLPGHGPSRPRRPGLRHRLGRAHQPLLRDERGPAGHAQAGHAAPPDGLLPGRCRHEPQAARARGDASVLQAAQEGAGGRPLRHQPGRLEHAQGRRAPPLDPPRRARPARPRERLPALSHGCARLPPRDHPRHRRDRRAARAGRAARRQPGQGPRLLRRARVEAPRRRARPRLRRRLPRRPHAGGDVRRDHRPRRRLRRRGLARASRARSSSRVRGSSTSSSAIRRRVSRPTS